MLLPFLVMNDTQAARFRELTMGDENKLDPRKVIAGPFIGKSVLPRRVMFDPAHAARQDLFQMLTEANFETDEAWPPEDL